jgi:hypothetical protein
LNCDIGGLDVALAEELDVGEFIAMVVEGVEAVVVGAGGLVDLLDDFGLVFALFGLSGNFQIFSLRRLAEGAVFS